MRLPSLMRNFAFRITAISGIGMILLMFVASIAIKDLLMDEKHDLTRAEVETVLSIAASFDRRSRNGEFSQEEARQRARDLIRSLRYQGKEYFFVTDMSLKLLVHPRPDLEGRNTGHEKDSRGFEYPQSFLTMAKKGGGYTHYLFPRPGTTEESRKVAYSAIYEPWGWIVSTGLYLDDIEAEYWGIMRLFMLISGSVFLGISILAYFASRQVVQAVEGRRLAEREALQSSRLAGIGQLAAGVAHEINTPAQYVSDNLHFIQNEVASLLTSLKSGTVPSGNENEMISQDITAAVRESLEGISRISKIVKSLLAFSHPGLAGMSSVDINQTLENVLTVSQHAWKPVATVECRFDPALPSVVCQADEIGQVLLSLILNGVEAVAGMKAAQPGRILIETMAEGDKAVVIRISDSGPGVPKDMRDRIFDPFFTTKAVGLGMGQGLAVSRDIVVTGHGGSLEVGDAQGGGAVFTVRLPLGGA